MKSQHRSVRLKRTPAFPCAAKAQLEAVPVPPRHRAHVVGFTDQMDELMAAADLVVSKPGGLTTSECLASGAVMVIVNPIPGQETRNSDFLLERGAAAKRAKLPRPQHVEHQECAHREKGKDPGSESEHGSYQGQTSDLQARLLLNTPCSYYPV